MYFIPNCVQITVKSFAFSRKEFSEKQGGNRTKFRIPKKSFVKLNNKCLIEILTFKNKGTEFHCLAKDLIILLQYLEIY
jgi:hypothetical protein